MWIGFILGVHNPSVGCLLASILLFIFYLYMYIFYSFSLSKKQSPACLFLSHNVTIILFVSLLKFMHGDYKHWRLWLMLLQVTLKFLWKYMKLSLRFLIRFVNTLFHFAENYSGCCFNDSAWLMITALLVNYPLNCFLSWNCCVFIHSSHSWNLFENNDFPLLKFEKSWNGRKVLWEKSTSDILNWLTLW